MLRPLTIVAWVLILSLLNFPEHIRLELARKWQATCEQDKEDDAAGPDVRSLPVVRLLFRQGRIHVVRRAAIHRQLLLLVAFDPETEVDYFYFILCTDEDVVQL